MGVNLLDISIKFHLLFSFSFSQTFSSQGPIFSSRYLNSVGGGVMEDLKKYCSMIKLLQKFVSLFSTGGRGGCSQGFGIAPRVLECAQDFGVAPRVLE